MNSIGKKIMDKIVRQLGTNRPYKWGVLYMLIIPVYAVIYMLAGYDNFNFGTLENNYLACLYLSVSSVTTLGIGDIHPLTNGAALLIASECVMGVIVIGLFLNSISFMKSQVISKKNKHRENLEKYIAECNQLLQSCKVINVSVNHYEEAILSMVKEDIDSLEKVDKNLQLTDMTHIFDNVFQHESMSSSYSKVNHFITINRNMLVNIRQLVKEINMEHWPDLEELCIKYIDQMSDLRVEEFFVKIEKDEKLVEKWVSRDQKKSKSKNEYINFYEQKEIFTPFMDLRKMLINAADFITNFRVSTKLIATLDPEEVIGNGKFE